MVSPPTTGDAGFGDPLVELEQVVDNGVRRSPEGNDETRGLGTRRCEIAEIHGCGSKPEIAKGDPVQPEVHALDECVLRDHEPVDLCRVVLDASGEPAALQLGEEAELAQVREPH